MGFRLSGDLIESLRSLAVVAAVGCFQSRGLFVSRCSCRQQTGNQSAADCHFFGVLRNKGHLLPDEILLATLSSQRCGKPIALFPNDRIIQSRDQLQGGGEFVDGGEQGYGSQKQLFAATPLIIKRLDIVDGTGEICFQPVLEFDEGGAWERFFGS